MENVGDILKKNRIENGLSLEQVEEATSIRKIYLSAIESGEYDKIPGDVFTKGIIRTYGNYLNLDGPELVNIYKAACAGIEPEELQTAEIRTAPKVSVSPYLKPQKKSSNIYKYFVISTVFLAVVIGAYFLFFSGNGDLAPVLPTKIATETQSQQQENVSTSEKNKIESDAKKAKERAEEALAAKKSITKESAKNDSVSNKEKNEGVNLYMFCNDRCWIEVVADGNKVFEGTLIGNQEQNFSATKQIVVKYGNIKAMKIAVNGTVMPQETLDGVIVKEYKK